MADSAPLDPTSPRFTLALLGLLAVGQLSDSAAAWMRPPPPAPTAELATVNTRLEAISKQLEVIGADVRRQGAAAAGVDVRLGVFDQRLSTVEKDVETLKGQRR